MCVAANGCCPGVSYLPLCNPLQATDAAQGHLTGVVPNTANRSCCKAHMVLSQSAPPVLTMPSAGGCKLGTLGICCCRSSDTSRAAEACGPDPSCACQQGSTWCHLQKVRYGAAHKPTHFQVYHCHQLRWLPQHRFCHITGP